MSYEVGIGRITTGIESNTLVNKTIAFVRRRLPEWRDDPDRVEEQSEDRLNVQLCKFLEVRARTDFPMVHFFHEEYQTGRRRVDLSALPTESIVIDARQYAIYSPFLVLEGKRLPAPSAGRELEYVTGSDDRNGGIQRFKLGLHGATLPVAVMLGYIQEHTPHYWHNAINGWISGLAAGSLVDVCTWEMTELLGMLDEDVTNRIAASMSTHLRFGNAASNTIQLHHLWVVMNVGTAKSPNQASQVRGPPAY